MKTLSIDPEFRAQIPPPTAEEFAMLEAEIAAHGIREPLTVWAGHGIILDGHNRYAIAQKHGLTYRIEEYEFPTREEAADWIDRNQLGRRNLTPDQMRLLVGRRYNRAKQGHGGQIPGKPSIRQNDESLGNNSTAKRLGKEHGIGQSTVERAGRFASDVEALKPLVPDIEQRVISGKGPTRKAVKEAAGLVESAPERAVLILSPPPAKSKGNGLANGYKRLPGKPIAERLARGIAALVSAADALASIDCDALKGSSEMKAALSDVRTVVQGLNRFRRNHEGIEA